VLTVCDCATGFVIRVGRGNEYRRAKRLLGVGRHPVFVGRDVVRRNALDGGLLFAVVDGADAAVALVNTKNSTLLVLNVHPAHRGHGLGAAFLAYLRPNFARVIENRVEWFARLGYIAVGEPKQGRTFATQVMVRAELTELAGRVRDLLGDRCRCAEQPEGPEEGNGPVECDHIGEDPMPAAGDGERVGRVADDVDELDQGDDGPADDGAAVEST
jgi:GNAT superfamily N-acetyltransferase